MKHIKLFESFITEAKGTPDNIITLVKGIQLGSVVVGKDATNKRNDHEAWNGKLSEDSWLDVLDQKLNRTGFSFEVIDGPGGLTPARRVYKINGYINMIINRDSSSASIDLEDALTYKTIKKQEYYGSDEVTTDAVAAAISANMDIFNQLKSADAENTSMSVRKLNSDKLASTVEKRLKGIYVAGNEAESIAHGILLRALDSLNPVQRAEGIQNIINTLNSYLKDKDYMDISK